MLSLKMSPETYLTLPPSLPPLPPPPPRSTKLFYMVNVKPKGPVPVGALEWRIKEDVPTNLRAVKVASEKLPWECEQDQAALAGTSLPPSLPPSYSHSRLLPSYPSPPWQPQLTRREVRAFLPNILDHSLIFTPSLPPFLPPSLPPSPSPALAAGRRELQSRMTVAQDWMSDETLGAYIGESPAGGGTHLALPPSFLPSLPSFPPLLPSFIFKPLLINLSP